MKELYDVKLEGIGKVNGGNYKNIKISGMGGILGDINGEIVTIEGTCKADGSIKCININVEGILEVAGSIEVNDKIYISGVTKIEGDFQGREAHINGKIDVKGLFSADKINILLVGKNKIKEIGGEVISVLEERRSFINGIIIPNRLISDSIEGDVITLENTVCEMVRGHNVTIKGGCKIENIEYTGDITIDVKSKVENVTKV